MATNIRTQQQMHETWLNTSRQ